MTFVDDQSWFHMIFVTFEIMGCLVHKRILTKFRNICFINCTSVFVSLTDETMVKISRKLHCRFLRCCKVFIGSFGSVVKYISPT